MKDSRQFRGNRIEVTMPREPGIYKVRIWDSNNGRYVDAARIPGSTQKPFRAKKRVSENGKSRQVSQYFQTLAEAREWRYTVNNVKRVTSRSTIGEVIQDWRASVTPPQIQMSTFETYGRTVVHMKFLTEIPVEELTALDIDQWLLHLKRPEYPKKPSRTSFLRELETFMNILNWYREYRNPSFRIPIVRRHRRDLVFRVKPLKTKHAMTHEQLELFLERLKKHHNPIYHYLALFQAFTGTRIGEACGLPWDAVDFEEGWVTIRQIVWWHHRDRSPELREGTKTGEVRRVVLCDRVVDSLKEWKEVSDNCDLVFHRKGELLHYPAIQNAFNKAFRNLDLPFRSTHVLRHTFATLFLDQTGHSEALRSVLGHRTLRMTERYAHPLEKSQVEAMKSFHVGKKGGGVEEK